MKWLFTYKITGDYTVRLEADTEEEAVKTADEFVRCANLGRLQVTNAELCKTEVLNGDKAQ